MRVDLLTVSEEADRLGISKVGKRGTRSLVAAWVAVCLAALSLATISTVQPGRAQSQPNIVYVVVDDLDLHYLPHLSRLKAMMADRGTTFENAFATTSLCCPSRASMLTGRYAHNHGVTANVAPLGGFEGFRDSGAEKNTIATHLRRSGYNTVLIGKYFNQYQGPEYVPPGWDKWYAQLGPPNSERLAENGYPVRYEEDMTDVLAEKAVRYIRRASGEATERPFFMYLAPAAPHRLSTAPERYQDRFEGLSIHRSPSFNEKDVSDKPAATRARARLGKEEIAEMEQTYRKGLRSMLAVEDMLGVVLKALREKGELGNTYVVFTSDHGVHMGEHRLPYGKTTAYEEDIGVPLFVRGPGVPRATTVDEMALNIDLAPTFAEMVGTPPLSNADGRSLLPLMHDHAPASWRQRFLVESYDEGQLASVAVRAKDAVYVEYSNFEGDREFYQLGEDPYQLESLHDTADPALLAPMKASLEALKDCVGSECRAAEDATSP